MDFQERGGHNILRPKDHALATALNAGLQSYEQHERPLPGIHDPAYRQSLLEQLVESVHRIQYFDAIRARPVIPAQLDPTTDSFDPFKAAMAHQGQGNIDEAFWLAFLAVHFGKNKKAGWQTAREVYGRLGTGTLWDWNTVSNNPAAFRQWLAANRIQIASRFGNHRKYESLNATSARGTGAVVESYVTWIGPAHSHQVTIQIAQQQVGNDPRALFQHLYDSMHAVASFGRTARFDYLTMIGKLGLVAIEPNAPYISGATGPLKGARLLFGGNTNAPLAPTRLNAWTSDLDGYLNQPFGMQVLEDALCNWQKSPQLFVPFRG